MARHAQSNTLKRRIAREEQEKRVQMGVRKYIEESEKGSPHGPSLRKIAEEFGIKCVTTLHNRIKGKQSIASFNESKQLLTPAEEQMVVELLQVSSNRSQPFNYDDIAHLANRILKARLGSDFRPVGKNWVVRCIERHHKELQTYWSKPLDSQRARCLNPDSVEGWFSILKAEILDKGIAPENIYAMDESGFPPSNQGTSRVVGCRGMKIQHKQGTANRENVTAIVTICADGTYLNPLIIFKAKYLRTAWIAPSRNIANADFARSENGWTDWDIALHWLEKCFAPSTLEKATGCTRVLILDGHSSHLSLSFLLSCRDHNIVVLCYPPHCTHALQGLDVVCFSKMKNEWHLALDHFYDTNMRGVNKEDFAEVFGNAFTNSFNPESISTAFQVTGVHPYDPTVIAPEKLKPSEVTSVKTVFPLPQPSPVRRIISAYCHHSSNASELEEEDIIQVDSTEVRNMHQYTHHSKHTVDDDIDPTLLSPSKRLRESLLQSSTGRYLASNTPIDPTQALHPPILGSIPPDIPQPDFTAIRNMKCTDQLSKKELQDQVKALTYNLGLAKSHIHAQRSINEAANAQLVMQYMHTEKLQTALQEKKKKKDKDRRAILFGEGKGRVVTSLEVISELQKEEDELKRKEEEKSIRRAARETKKDAKEKLERQWEAIKKMHDKAIQHWNTECTHLAEQKVPKNRWPVKPKRPLKPREAAVALDRAGSASDEDDDSDRSE